MEKEVSEFKPEQQAVLPSNIDTLDKDKDNSGEGATPEERDQINLS